MAGIFQTIKWLREGKKVRREGWKEGSYWVLGDDERINWKFEAAKVSLYQIEATDWELFKEKKNYQEDEIKKLVKKLVKKLMKYLELNKEETKW